MNLRLRARQSAVLAVGIALAACGGGDKSPAAPPSAPPATQPSAPTGAPSTVLSQSCLRIGGSLAAGTEKCAKENPDFLAEVDDAINDLIHEKPEIFNLNDEKGAGGYRILSEGAFTVGVIQNLDKKGLCGGQYAEELAVKKNNNYSENYDIVTADQHIRRGTGSYASTCTPASFTNRDAPQGTNAGCTLSYSRTLVCSRESKGVFLAQVMAAIDKVAKEHPEYFDFNDHAKGTDWYKVKNPDAYTKGIVANLLAVGLCARWDGEEINVKNTNDWSENYDILLADNHVWLGAGTYRVTCYPAYF
jgi:hypothetical protein